MRQDSTSLLPIMPYQLFNRLSDEDAAALIAWLKRLPAVDNELPPMKIRIPGYAMVSLADMQDSAGG